MDALLAMILTVAFFGVIGISMQEMEKPGTRTTIQIKQMADDIFTALDNSGLLAKRLADAELNELALTNPREPVLLPGIYDEARKMLPKNAELKVVINEYSPPSNLDACRAAYASYRATPGSSIETVFTACFGSAPRATAEYPAVPLPEKEVAHGRKVLMMRQPVSDKIQQQKCLLPSEIGLEEKKAGPIAALEGALEADIKTWVDVRDPVTQDSLTEISCDQPAEMLLKARNMTRDPIAIMLATDKSGSMATYDMLSKTATGSFNEGSCQNQLKWVAGKYGNALHFDGNYNYGYVPYDSRLSATSGITLSAWIKADSFQTNNEPWQGIILKKTQGPYEMWIIENKPGFGLKINGANDPANCWISDCPGGKNCLCRVASSYTLNTNIWYHLLYTYDGQDMKIYVDKDLKGTWHYPGTIIPQTQPIYIGWAGYSKQFFNGVIDDARVFNRALNSAEIETVYNGNEVSDGLMARWKFDEASGNAAADSGGNGFTAALWNWAFGDGPGCQYTAGTPAGPPISNCPANKTLFSSFTGKQKILDYDLGPLYDGWMQNSYLDFIAASTTYGGACTSPSASMRLWVEKPDSAIESDQPSGYWEDVLTPANGIYKAHVWSDTPVYYNIWGRQRIPSTADPMFSQTKTPNALSGNSTHDGFYSPPEQECTYNLLGWEKLGEFDIPANYSTMYYMPWAITYSGYAGDCYAPRFEIKRIGGESAVWGQPGKAGNAMSLDGAASKNFAAATEKLSSDFGFKDWTGSVSLWFKTSSTSQQSLISRWGRTEWTGWNIYTSGNSVCFNIVTRNPSQNNMSCNSAGIATDGQWHHAAGVWNDHSVTLYFDGAAGTTATIPAGATYDQGSQMAWIGRNNYSLAGFYSGLLDDVRIYGKALSAAEAEQLRQWGINGGSGQLPESSTLVAYWSFDTDTERTISDSSGNGNGAELNVWSNIMTAGTPYCGNGTTAKSCTLYLNEMVGNGTSSPANTGPYIATGHYEIWGWSDSPIGTVTMSANLAQRYLGILFGNPGRTDVISGGTCGGLPCATTNPPTIPPETNCPPAGLSPVSTPSSKAWWQGMLNWKVVDKTSVSSNLRGYKIDVTFSGDSGAVCGGGAAGFQNPVSGSQSPNWFTWFPAAGSSSSGGFGVNYAGWANWASGPPIAYGDYNVIGWAEQPVDYTVKWYLQRVDAVKNAAKTFMDNAQWKSSDTIGLVGFSTSTTVLEALTTDRAAVKTALDGLAPSGETAIADAITASTTELLKSAAGTGKFIVLLTDGKANVCLGGAACTEAAAAASAIAAANAARANGVTVYVIGFADTAIIGAYEGTLRQIAKNKDEADPNKDYCDEEPVPGENCGKYYYAADESALAEMYDLIAYEIARAIGSVDITVPIPPGVEVTGYSDSPTTPADNSCGIWDDTTQSFAEINSCNAACSSGGSTCVGGETLTYSGLPISYRTPYWWAGKLLVVLPCDQQNCDQNAMLFPPDLRAGPPDYEPKKTRIKDNASEDWIDWDGDDDSTIICGTVDHPNPNEKCHRQLAVKYSDLNVAFAGGYFSGSSNPFSEITIDIDMNNNGYSGIPLPPTATEGLQIAFYQNDFSHKLAVTNKGTAYIGGTTNTATAISDGNLYIGMSVIPPGQICYSPPANPLSGNCDDIEPQPQALSYWKTGVKGVKIGGCTGGACTGMIIARINWNKKVSECPLNNTAQIFCLSESRFRFYTVDYYVWVK